MKSALRILAASMALTLSATVAAQGQPIKIVGLVELSGAGATAGTNFDNGVKLAVKEINAARRHPRPQGRVSRSSTRRRTRASPRRSRRRRSTRAPTSSWGRCSPARSSSAWPRRKRAEIPNFTGGEAARHHAAGQSVHLPHVVHAVDGDAEGREVHQGRREGEDGRRHVGQQRLRQGRPRRDHQGARGAGHQGRAPTSRPIRARSTSPARC